ncbi:MAG: hypothetical protein H7287_04735 [Thermoleophilia bacterium]|nr:hypothetical protein [Thermoleophilia bacterium]
MFERLGLRDHGAPPVHGLLDSLDDHRSAGFDPTEVAPAVRAFYEHTSDFALDTATFPRRWFWPALWLFSQLSRRLEQTDFPLGVEPERARATSQLFGVHRSGTAGGQRRAWVRTYADTSGSGRSPRVLYAALYATHVGPLGRYLDIAFPFPGGTLTSVLRFESLASGGTELTTRDFAPSSRQSGIYWVTRRHAVRLPMGEVIRVWDGASDAAPVARLRGTNAAVVAEHRLYLFGAHFLTLHYLAHRSALA